MIEIDMYMHLRNFLINVDIYDCKFHFRKCVWFEISIKDLFFNMVLLILLSKNGTFEKYPKYECWPMS